MPTSVDFFEEGMINRERREICHRRSLFLEEND